MTTTQMATRWARVVRGWIAAVVSVFVAMCSHALAGGPVPSAAGVALCLAFAAMVCIALAGTSLSLTRLSVSVAISQFLFHGAFSILGTPSSPAVSATVTLGTQQMAAMRMGQPSLPTAIPATDAGMAMPQWMWFTHGAAAIVTILALRFGERAFWRLIALARPLVRGLLTPLPAPIESREDAGHAVRRDERAPRRHDIVLSTRRRRGPPCPAAL